MVVMNRQPNAKNTLTFEQRHRNPGHAVNYLRHMGLCIVFHKQQGGKLQSFSGAFYPSVWPAFQN